MVSANGPSIDLRDLTTDSLLDRPSKVFRRHLGRPLAAGAGMADLIASLPAVLGADDLRATVAAIRTARRSGRPVGAALGGHVIKTGCAPYLIDWIDRGVLTAVALNGAAAIHDFELALAGHTSEDVAAQLPAGRFGMARETAEAFARSAEWAAADGLGLGRALGRYIGEIGCPHRDISLVFAAFRAGIPCTVHVALGTDIVHMHPNVSGAALGAASMADFHGLCATVAGFEAGVWMNLGSAVILPEVFLKAVSVAHNLGRSLAGLTTVNLDMVQHYRGRLNVVQRPGARGIALVGQHEILIPLLHAAVGEDAGCRRLI